MQQQYRNVSVWSMIWSHDCPATDDSIGTCHSGCTLVDTLGHCQCCGDRHGLMSSPPATWVPRAVQSTHLAMQDMQQAAAIRQGEEDAALVRLPL
jgi:hypothetical protein